MKITSLVAKRDFKLRGYGFRVYLYCAAMGLATVVRANFDGAALAKAMGLPDGRRVTLAQSVGYPKA